MLNKEKTWEEEFRVDALALLIPGILLSIRNLN